MYRLHLFQRDFADQAFPSIKANLSEEKQENIHGTEGILRRTKIPLFSLGQMGDISWDYLEMEHFHCFLSGGRAFQVIFIHASET